MSCCFGFLGGRPTSVIFNGKKEAKPEAPQMLDDLSTSERVSEILQKEPVIEKTPDVLELFAKELRRLDPATSCNAAHGTNLAAALSACRNTNGQLVSINLMERLGKLRVSGATPEMYFAGGETNPLRRLVFGANLKFRRKAIETAEKYAYGEGGAARQGHIVNSEAACFPVLLIGSLIDPRGEGARLNDQFQNPEPDLPAKIPKGNPLYGWTFEEIKEEFADQLIGECFNIRMVFVAHPTDPEKDPDVLDMVKELLMTVVAEQESDYSDIHVGLLRQEVAMFKAAAADGDVNEDIHRYLYEPTTPLIRK